MATLAARFHSLVERRGPHRLWLGATDRNGVPQIRVDGRLTTARRVAWELERGPLPHNVRIRGCAIDPRCVRLNHLTVIESQKRLPRIRRPRGEGSLREVRPGVWQLAITIATGDRTFHTIIGDQGDAERELARLTSKHGHAPTTLDALVAIHVAHLRDRGRSPSTLRRYQQLWRTWLAPSLGAIPPDEMHRADVEHTLTAMHEAGQSERSIHQAATVLNTTLAWARDQQLTRTNPVIGSELPNGTTITATRHR
jgi:hypothetical protein